MNKFAAMIFVAWTATPALAIDVGGCTEPPFQPGILRSYAHMDASMLCDFTGKIAF